MASSIRYKRARFSASLPEDYLYTPSHYWLHQQSSGPWKIGLTKFAVRMLGELVEYDFEVEAHASIKVGEIIGWIEGFKANSDLYSCIQGHYLGDNDALNQNPELLHAKPHHEGWLFNAEGDIDDKAMDVHGYIAYLDQTIDQLEGSAQ